MPTPQRQSPQPQADSSQIFVMFFMLIFMLVIFTPDLREGMGGAMGGLLEPLIGFDNEYPVLTIFLAGMVMILLSTTIRHFFIDWMEMARIQKMMFAFNKELREAQIARNQRRVEKLMELQPEVMRMNAELSSNQMKPMMFTMLVAIPIFMWLNSFIDDLSLKYITIPWETHWYMRDRFIILPQWVLIYSFLTLPIGQLYMRWLKTRELKSSLSKDEEHIEENTQESIDLAQNALQKLRRESVPYDDLDKELMDAISQQGRGDLKLALKNAEHVKKQAKARMNQMETAQEHLRSLEDMRKVVDVDANTEKDFTEATKAFESGDYASSMYYAKQAKKVLIEGVAQQEYRETEINRIKDIIETEELDPTRIQECLDRSMKARDRDEFDEHMEQAEREVENTIKEREKLDELKTEVLRKIQEGYFEDEFDEELKILDELTNRRSFDELASFLEELNLKVLRRIKAV